MFRTHFHRCACKPVTLLGDAFMYQQAFAQAARFCKDMSGRAWAAFTGETTKE